MKKHIKILLCVVLFIVLILAGRTISDFLTESDRSENSRTKYEIGNYSGYYYSQLNETQKQAYTQIKENIIYFPSTIQLPEIDEKALTKVIDALIYDDPYLFMFEDCKLYTLGSVCRLAPEYTLSSKEYQTACVQLEQITEEIINGMPHGLSAFDKELYLHDSIVNRCVYSMTDKPEEANVIGVFINGKAKCTGYAHAFKLLLEKVGINSIVLSGDATESGKTVSHMWNAVELDGSWYYTDPTWNDPVTDNGEGLCQHIYFNMTEEMIRKTHSNFSFDYESTDNSLYYYCYLDRYFTAYTKETVSDIACLISEAVTVGQPQLDFMFCDSFSFEKAANGLFANEDIYQALTLAQAMTSIPFSTQQIRYSLNNDNNIITVYLL